MNKYIIKLFILTILIVFNINLTNAQNIVTDEMLITAQEDPNNWLMVIRYIISGLSSASL